MVVTGMRVSEEGVQEDEENFAEAVTHVNSALVKTGVSHFFLHLNIIEEPRIMSNAGRIA
jgi:hypothetical protein